jgi:hypothetical protein
LTKIQIFQNIRSFVFKNTPENTMNIDHWAQRIAAEFSIAGDERPPMDAVLLAHMDEFDELMRSTRLKIPAFARALTRAGVTLKSGKPYSAETLRAQVNRARARRAREATATPRTVTVRPDPSISQALAANTPEPAPPSVPGGPNMPPRANGDVLSKLGRLRPKRLTALEE